MAYKVIFLVCMSIQTTARRQWVANFRCHYCH